MPRDLGDIIFVALDIFKFSIQCDVSYVLFQKVKLYCVPSPVFIVCFLSHKLLFEKCLSRAVYLCV